MVLETIDILKSERHPKKMILLAFAYSTIGLFISLAIFGEYASITGIFLTTMPLIIIMYNALKLEEEKDMRIHEEKFLIKEHTHILSLFLFLFAGLVLSYSFWFTVLPPDSAATAFKSQMETIGSISGGQISVSGSFLGTSLGAILKNNFRVLILCIAFSFLYGSGAIFILTWNASVIGVAIGNAIRSTIVNYSTKNAIYGYFIGFPLSMGYLIHGIFEILAYFTGALAGGIISFAMVNHHYRSKEFRHVLVDSIDLIVASVAILILAALIEVYVTPALFL